MTSQDTPASSQDDITATRRIGRCELFHPIAKGGMATVHLGRWVGMGGFRKVVAVKAMHPQFAQDPEFVSMFLDEARVVARIRHPNVIPTLDLVEEDGDLFIVMDYVEGVTLGFLAKQIRRRKTIMPVTIVKRIMAGVLHGLHAAHEATNAKGEPMCVIHRDVSPDNILVGTDGYARLIDFGIARALGRSSETRAGVIKGKLAYLAPEQLLEKPLSRRTDVYGASVVMWQSLTGRRLFKGENPGEIAMKVIDQPVPKPGEVAEGIDEALDAIVMRGLSRPPKKRWATAEEMAEAIEASGGLASHRAVGEWVRSMAAERVDQSRTMVQAVEEAPAMPAAPAQRITRAPSMPELEIEVWSGTGEHEPSRTDVTSEADSGHTQTAAQRPSLLRQVAVAAVVAATVTFAALGAHRAGAANEASGADAPVAAAQPPEMPPEAAEAEVLPTPPERERSPGEDEPKGESDGSDGAESTTPTSSAEPSANPAAPKATTAPRPWRPPPAYRPRPTPPDADSSRFPGGI